ncbi:MAG: hypothetical protein ACO3JL_13910, partial [Myxococcota bacterium]
LRLSGLAGYDDLDVTAKVPETSDTPLEWRMPAQITEYILSSEPLDTMLKPQEGPARRGKLTLHVPRGSSQVVTLQRPGCVPQNLALAGEGESRVERTVTMRCADFDARLTVHGSRGAEIELDGVALGRKVPLREFPLPAGEHLLIASHRGRRVAILVEVRSGETGAVNVKLR